MLCSKCGKEIPEDSRFCLSCGTKIENASDLLNSRTQPLESSVPANNAADSLKNPDQSPIDKSDSKISDKKDNTFVTIMFAIVVISILYSVGLTPKNIGAAVQTATQNISANPYKEKPAPLRDVIAAGANFDESYLYKDVVIGPLKVSRNDIERGCFSTYMSTGPEKYDIDTDAGIEISYQNLSDSKTWRNLPSDERAIIYVKGTVVEYNNSNSCYIEAKSIKRVD